MLLFVLMAGALDDIVGDRNNLLGYHGNHNFNVLVLFRFLVFVVDDDALRGVSMLHSLASA